ncbi:MAG: NAD(P)H-hydrate dehydratase [Rubrivivax sp.]|nr:MAG: NAD(P)H-hydrate dehydratase [Rubrivivax sp.]
MDPKALLTVAEMKQAEHLTMQSGTAGLVLMERAGEAVAAAIMARWAPTSVVVLCGPGNNGGDGFVVARRLSEAGWPVRVALLGEWSALTGDALVQSRHWAPASCVPVHPDALVGAGLVVDALFGTGLSRALSDVAAQTLRAVAESHIPMVAVDVPSGVFGDTGADGGAAPAALTVTFHRAKPAHVLMPGRALCGEVVVADIGLHPEADRLVKPRAFENHPGLWRADWPALALAGHKYRRGHALVYGGGLMTGAARLSARASARIGAGLTTVATPESAWPVYASALSSIMVHPLAGSDALELAAAMRGLLGDQRISAVLVGPGAAGGLARGVRPLVEVALASGRPVVLDADALTAFEHDPPALFNAIRAFKRPVVLTPHEGEFARLFPQAQAAHADDKLTRARLAAQASGAIVVLKGPDTVVASPDGWAVVNTNAPPTLATAGSGDVLAGFITGLLAQGMAPEAAVAAAVYLHGEAARAFGPGLMAEDLPDQLPAVLRRLFS